MQLPSSDRFFTQATRKNLVNVSFLWCQIFLFNSTKDNQFMNKLFSNHTTNKKIMVIHGKDILAVLIYLPQQCTNTDTNCVKGRINKIEI